MKSLRARLCTLVFLGSAVARAGSISSGGGVTRPEPADDAFASSTIASCPVTKDGKLEIRSRTVSQNGAETFFFEASVLDATGKKIAGFFGLMGPDGMIRFQPWQQMAQALVRGINSTAPALIYSAAVGMVWMQHVIPGASAGNAGAQGHFHQIPCERLFSN